MKECVGIKCKDVILAELCLKPWFESDYGIFVKLLSQDGFESDCSETKFQTITSKVNSEAVIPRCSSKYAFLKKFSIFTGKYLCWSLFYKVAGLQLY